MTEMDMKRRDIESREREGAKDRHSREKIARKKNITDIVTSSIGTAAKTGVDAAKLLMAGNHKEWYNKFPQLVKDVANIPFSVPLGAEGNLPAGKVSGICSLLAYPVLPKGHSTVSGARKEEGAELVSEAVMQAVRSQYAAIRKANSGAKNYEYTDLLRYTLAIESAYDIIADACRAYALANKFDANNRFVGDKLLKATGWNSTNVRTNLSQFRACINRYINYLKSFPLPGFSTVVSRHVWMFSNVFKDSNIKRSQLYVYTLGGVYQLSSEEVGIPGRVQVLSFRGVHGTSAGDRGGSFLTVNDFDNIMSDIIAALQNDPYAAIISGDIIKAYGDVHAVTFNTIPADYSIDFVYDANTLTQIFGATITGGGYAPEFSFDVHQLTVGEGATQQQSLAQRLPMNPTILGASPKFGEHPMIVNMYKDDVTPDDVMVATRLTASLGFAEVKSGLFSGIATMIQSCCTEIITAAQIFYYDASLKIDGVANVNGSYQTGMDENVLTSYLLFDWAPALYLVANEGDDETTLAQYFKGTLSDLCNFTNINNETLIKLHDVASMTLYGLLI